MLNYQLFSKLKADRKLMINLIICLVFEHYPPKRKRKRK
jgi:hypothetical protein